MRKHSAETRFADRWQAGQLLGDALAPLVTDVRPANRVVLGLARGGVVVAAEVAARLDAILDAVVVRKIGSPFQFELAIGAVGPEGVRVFNQGVIADLGLSEPEVSQLADRAARSRDQLDHELRGGRPATRLEGKLAILVDDGLATGASMRAALNFARRSAAAVIVAVPTAAPDVLATFETRGIRTQALMTPVPFGSVGSWYDEFGDVPSADVTALLGQDPSSRSNGRNPAPGITA